MAIGIRRFSYWIPQSRVFHCSLEAIRFFGLLIKKIYDLASGARNCVSAASLSFFLFVSLTPRAHDKTLSQYACCNTVFQANPGPFLTLLPQFRCGDPGARTYRLRSAYDLSSVESEYCERVSGLWTERAIVSIHVLLRVIFVEKRSIFNRDRR